MSRFRLIFASPAPPAEAFGAARQAMRDWPAHSRYDSATLSHIAASFPGGGHAEQWRLLGNSPGNSPGNSRASLALTVYSPPVAATATAETPATTWFWLEETRESSLAGTDCVTDLVRGLLDSVAARDSLAVLATAPTPVGPDQIDDLLEVLCDPHRRLPAMVATAHPAATLEGWTQTIAQVTRGASGLASTYILDEPGTAAFNEAIGESHAVWGGALRTYLPEVDPAVPSDGLRHRVMLAARIAADPRRVGEVLVDLPRRLAVESPLPLPLAGVNRMLLTQGREAPDPTASLPPAADTEDPDAKRHSSISAPKLERRLERLRRERDDALALAEEQEERANSLFTERETLLAQLAEREQQVLELDAAVRAFRQRLIEAGVPADSLAPLEAPPDAPPAEFAELLDWAERHLRRVQYTGDIGEPLELAKSPESATWVRSSWEALRALEAYAAWKGEHGFSGDFRKWCVAPPSPDQYTISPNKVKMDESETVRTKPKWHQERVFRVPQEVDPDGRAFMGAHVTIGASANGRINPRLYFLDAVLKTGRIYVGYIGRHLTNTLSLQPNAPSHIAPSASSYCCLFRRPSPNQLLTVGG